MSFTSQIFLIFCLLFYPAYFATKGTRYNNYVIVIASCIFYGWWDWRFVCLFGVTTCFDFAAARLLERERTQARRLMLVWVSMSANLLMLGFFKYSNFLVGNLNLLFKPLGVLFGDWYLAVLLPAGLSFYTFQSMSYTIDVYRRRIKASSSLIEFLAYVSFFPHMIAGPIQRSTHFLPQFRTERKFDFELAANGLRQIIWGLIKKVVVADNLAPIVEAAFSDPSSLHAGDVSLAAIFFAIQIYCDFSGYSDIAIGLAKIMGFDLSRNFAYPYFSSNIQEFWRRWHMSLTGWFREYVYQPLGGSQTSTWRWIRNVMLVFVLSGLWHGADWKFVIWGLIHGTAYLGFILYSFAADPSPRGALRGLLGWAATMIVVVVGWIFFRAATMSDALTMVSILLTPSEWLIKPHHWFPYTLLLIGFFMAIEWTGRNYDHPLAFPFLGFWKREAIVIASIFALALLGASSGSQFVYFQF